MARLVLDTNSLLQCISHRSRYHDFNMIVADPDDNKFVDCAIACNAQFIVTEDTHYNVLQNIEFPKVDIIKLDDIILKI